MRGGWGGGEPRCPPRLLCATQPRCHAAIAYRELTLGRTGAAVEGEREWLKGGMMNAYPRVFDSITCPTVWACATCLDSGSADAFVCSPSDWFGIRSNRVPVGLNSQQPNLRRIILSSFTPTHPVTSFDRVTFKCFTLPVAHTSARLRLDRVAF